MNEKTAIVLAAGKGTRMKSGLPKVLVPVCGRPMIDYVLDALSAGGVECILIVVGYRAELVRQSADGRPGVQFALLVAQGKEVRTLPVLKPCEALGINTLDELAAVEAEMRGKR